jgi:hypothetical protein
MTIRRQETPRNTKQHGISVGPADPILARKRRSLQQSNQEESPWTAIRQTAAE